MPGPAASWYSSPCSGAWNEQVMRKVSLPSTALTNDRVENERPSRMGSTWWIVVAPGGVGRRKYPCREWISEAGGAVWSAAFRAWATTMPPKVRPPSHHVGLFVAKVRRSPCAGPDSVAVIAWSRSATVADTTSASSAGSSSNARPRIRRRAHDRSTSTDKPLDARSTQRLSSA